MDEIAWCIQSLSFFLFRFFVLFVTWRRLLLWYFCWRFFQFFSTNRQYDVKCIYGFPFLVMLYETCVHETNSIQSQNIKSILFADCSKSTRCTVFKSTFHNVIDSIECQYVLCISVLMEIFFSKCCLRSICNCVRCVFLSLTSFIPFSFAHYAMTKIAKSKPWIWLGFLLWAKMKWSQIVFFALS